MLACAQAWRGDGAILASPMGTIPTLGARLARLTFAPELLLSDGEATLLAPGDRTLDDRTAEGRTTEGWMAEGWLPYRDVLRLVATGRRHVMMGAAQLDRFGNQNISCIGDWSRPKAQLLGVRGSPGNTINHPVSYWIPRHSARVLVERVDMVSGIGYDRAAALAPAALAPAGLAPAALNPAALATAGPNGPAWHDLRLVVTDKAVLDFATPDHSMRVRSLHPGVSVQEVQSLTGFALTVPDDLAVTPMPTAAELALIREQLDPAGLRDRELS